MWSCFLAGGLLFYKILNIILIIPRGTRSLQSCLGGGDIDGDEYNIIMDVCSFGFFFCLDIDRRLSQTCTLPVLQHQALISPLNARGPKGRVLSMT